MRDVDHVGAQPVAPLVEIDDDRLHLGEVAHQVGPRHLDLRLFDAGLQIDLGSQGEEADNDVPDAGVVTMMEDTPDLDRELLLAGDGRRRSSANLTRACAVRHAAG